jgi:hypothetical protein
MSVLMSSRRLYGDSVLLYRHCELGRPTRLISQSEGNAEIRSTDQSASYLFVWLLSCFCYPEQMRSNTHIIW